MVKCVLTSNRLVVLRLTESKPVARHTGGVHLFSNFDDGRGSAQ